MRYTEARLSKITGLLLDEIDRARWTCAQLRRQHRGAQQLPARLPFSLLNGASGIAVGLATEIPSHNLREVAAPAWLIKKPQLAEEELLALIPGPDYPGGGQIISAAAISPMPTARAVAVSRCVRAGRSKSWHAASGSWW
jgi:topoisomerase-4 subunit A